MKKTAKDLEAVVAVAIVVICLSLGVFKDRLTGVRGLAKELFEKTDFD